MAMILTLQTFNNFFLVMIKGRIVFTAFKFRLRLLPVEPAMYIQLKWRSVDYEYPTSSPKLKIKNSLDEYSRDQSKPHSNLHFGIPIGW
jgi:hypothetical protein